MTRIRAVGDDEAAADPVLAALYEGARKLVGRVPNSIRVRAHLPRVAAWNLAVITSLQRPGGGGNLEGSLKELVVLKTSLLNKCEYCVTHNTVLAQETGLSVEQVEALQGDYLASPLLSDREKAAIRWAEAVTLNTAARDNEAFENLQQHFTESEILEITWLSAYFNMANRMQESLRVDIESPEQVQLIRKRASTSEAAILDFVVSMTEAFQAETTGAPDAVSR